MRAKQNYYTHPSMVKVTELSEAFLKEAHKIMRGKGYKLDSGVQSAEINWVYEKEGAPSVYMHGWHGRDPRNWGAGKTVWGIDVEGSNSTFMNSDCHILNCSDDVDHEIKFGRMHNVMTDEKIAMYAENLKKGIEFLKNIEVYGNQLQAQ